MFDKDFNDAATGYGRNYAPAGFNGDVRIDVIGERLPKDSFKGEHSFFAEFTAPNGVQYSWVQKIPEKDTVADKGRTRALATIKGFLAALVGPEEFERSNHAEVYKLATSDANPFAGTMVHLSTVAKPKKNSPGMFTVHNWTPAEGA